MISDDMIFAPQSPRPRREAPRPTSALSESNSAIAESDGVVLMTPRVSSPDMREMLSSIGFCPDSPRSGYEGTFPEAASSAHLSVEHFSEPRRVITPRVRVTLGDGPYTAIRTEGLSGNEAARALVGELLLRLAGRAPVRAYTDGHVTGEELTLEIPQLPQQPDPPSTDRQPMDADSESESSRSDGMYDSPSHANFAGSASTPLPSPFGTLTVRDASGHASDTGAGLSGSKRPLAYADPTTPRQAPVQQPFDALHSPLPPLKRERLE